MPTTKVEYKIEAATISKDLAKTLSDARAAVSAAEKALIDAYRASPRHQAITDLAGYGSSAYGKSQPIPHVVGSQIVCTVFLDVPAEKTKPQVYLDPKTANLLLSGKLLTDAEKRELLKSMGVDLPLAAEQSEAAA